MSEAYHRAIAAFQLRRYDLCKQCLHDALTEDPTNVDVIVYLSNVHLFLGEYPAARSFAQNAIQLDPEHPGGYRILAWATISDINHCPGDPKFSPMTSDNRKGLEKRLTVARELTDRSLEIDPENELGHGLLAEIEFLSDDPRAALQAAESGLRYNPLSGQCARARMRAFDLLGNLQAAEEAGRERLVLDPDDAGCHHQLAMNYLQQRNLSAATRHAREAVRLDPDEASHRETYWDSIKAKNPFFRPMVYWQFVVKRFSRLPERLKTVCLVALPALAGMSAVFAEKHLGFKGAPIAMVVSVLIATWLFASDRPCMSIVDLLMAATDPQYRQIANKKELAISAGTTLIALVAILCFSLFAFQIYWPLGALVAAMFFALSVACVVHSKSWTWRIVLLLNMLAMGLLLSFGVNLFRGSAPNSPERLNGMYLVMGFIFLSLAGPILYDHFTNDRKELAGTEMQ